MHLPEFALLAIATIAAIAAGFGIGMLALGRPRFGVVRVLFWISALTFASLGIVWSATPDHPLWVHMAVSGAIGAIAFTGLAWGLWEVRHQEQTVIDLSKSPQIEVRFEPRPPYETADIQNQGRILSVIRIGLQAVGQSFSNCKVYVAKIAPEPPLAGGLPILLDGGGFVLRPDDPETRIDVAAHWEHVNQFRFNAPIGGGFFAETLNFIDDKPRRAIDLKIEAFKIDGSQFEKTVRFDLWTDEAKRLHLKFR